MSFFGFKLTKGEFGKLVDNLRRANTLSLASEARTNILSDVEKKITELQKERNTLEDERKIKAIRLLLEILKTKGNVIREPDLATLKEQGELKKKQRDYYLDLLKQSMNYRIFLNTKESPAPNTVRQAKAAINESLRSLNNLIRQKYNNSATVKARRAEMREEKRIAEIAEREAVVEEARVAAGLPARKPASDPRVNALAARLESLKRPGLGRGAAGNGSGAGNGNGSGAAPASGAAPYDPELDELEKELSYFKGGKKSRRTRTRKMRRRGKKGTRKH